MSRSRIKLIDVAQCNLTQLLHSILKLMCPVQPKRTARFSYCYTGKMVLSWLAAANEFSHRRTVVCLVLMPLPLQRKFTSRHSTDRFLVRRHLSTERQKNDECDEEISISALCFPTMSRLSLLRCHSKLAASGQTQASKSANKTISDSKHPAL